MLDKHNDLVLFQMKFQLLLTKFVLFSAGKNPKLWSRKKEEDIIL